LAGVLVADFSRVVAGPYAAMLLGDLGAEVVKVERPGSGDDTRGFGPPFVDDGAGGTTSSYYLSVNRNKRGVAWDLATEDGRKKARALAERADVLIENFKPGAASRLGLDYEELAEVNPGLVYCSVSGFGWGEEGSKLAGYDFLAQAVGGLMSITGDPPATGGEARKVGVAVIDVLTALFAANGVVAALYERRQSGRGQLVRVDLLSSSLAALINQASTYLTTGRIPRAMGNRHPSIAPYETLSASDRALVVAVGNDGQFVSFCRAIGRPELATDERFAKNAGRVANRDEMVAELEAALSSRRASEWVALLEEAGVPSGVVNDISEAFMMADRLGLEPRIHLGEDGSVASSGDFEPDPLAQVASPLRLSRTPVSYRRPPPRLAQHSGEVESELGEKSP
jgi:crotonobetainyl-CoA:carnitine CoA-transferase CaiB-like acyl-CoA transferase